MALPCGGVLLYRIKNLDYCRKNIRIWKNKWSCVDNASGWHYNSPQHEVQDDVMNKETEV